VAEDNSLILFHLQQGLGNIQRRGNKYPSEGDRAEREMRWHDTISAVHMQWFCDSEAVFVSKLVFYLVCYKNTPLRENLLTFSV
jgi:hypothetical protein